MVGLVVFPDPKGTYLLEHAVDYKNPLLSI